MLAREDAEVLPQSKQEQTLPDKEERHDRGAKMGLCSAGAAGAGVGLGKLPDFDSGPPAPHGEDISELI